MTDQVFKYFFFIFFSMVAFTAPGCTGNDCPEPETIQVEIFPDTIEVMRNIKPVLLSIDIIEAAGQIASISLIHKQDTVLFDNTFTSEGIYSDTLRIGDATFIKKGHFINVELQPNEDDLKTYKIDIVADSYSFNPVFIRQEALPPPAN